MYTKQTWQNLPDQTTPLTAERLSHMETQYEEALNEVEAQIGDDNTPIGAALEAAFGGGGGGAVDSVNGQVGTVSLDAADVGARPDTWTPTAADVGARPDSWTPAVGDIPSLPASKVGSGTFDAARLPAATDTVAGAVARATQAQVDAGTDTATFVTPAALAAKFPVYESFEDLPAEGVVGRIYFIDKGA